MVKCKECHREVDEVSDQGRCNDCYYRGLSLDNNYNKVCVDCGSLLLEVQEVKLVINEVIDPVLRRIKFCSLCGMAYDEYGVELVAISIEDGNIYKNINQTFIECTIKREIKK